MIGLFRFCKLCCSRGLRKLGHTRRLGRVISSILVLLGFLYGFLARTLNYKEKNNVIHNVSRIHILSPSPIMWAPEPGLTKGVRPENRHNPPDSVNQLTDTDRLASWGSHVDSGGLFPGAVPKPLFAGSSILGQSGASGAYFHP